jgi:uncharacterized damage-inducible protein DinB
MTSIADHFARLWTFHHWATSRAFDALAAVSAAELDRSWGGSFGTGRALLCHVLGVEWLWGERLNGRPSTAIPEYLADYGGRDFSNAWQEIRATQGAAADGLMPGGLATELTYVNIKGERCTYPLADVLFQCVNHGTYHRGQIIQLLRDLGRDAPPTDFTVFLQAQRRG